VVATKQTNIRLDAELRKWYDDLGAENERDATFYMRKALEKYRDEHGVKPANTVSVPKKEVPDWADSVIAEFWSSYPKKVDKKKAIERLKKMIVSKPILEFYEGIILKVISKSMVTEAKFFPSPDRYLRDERWNDEIDQPTQSSRDAQLAAMDAQLGFGGQTIEGEVQNNLLLGDRND